MYYIIFVRAQVDPKILSAKRIVNINRNLGGETTVQKLKPSDDFEYDGIWYDVREIYGPFTEEEKTKYINYGVNILALQRIKQQMEFDQQQLLTKNT